MLKLARPTQLQYEALVGTMAYPRTANKSVPVRISTAILKDKRGNMVGGVETIWDVSPLSL
jgi:hypothetical protein